MQNKNYICKIKLIVYNVVNKITMKVKAIYSGFEVS